METGYQIIVGLLALVAITCALVSNLSGLINIIRNVFRRRQERANELNANLEMTLHSRHTIPVSILVHGECADSIKRSINAATRVLYPEFEVISVFNGSQQELEESGLLDDFRFVTETYYSCDVIPVRGTFTRYRSKNLGHLSLIHFEDSDATNAINAAVNSALYRYILPVPAPVTLLSDSLLKMIQPALANPKNRVAVCAPVGGNDLSTHPNSITTALDLVEGLYRRLTSPLGPRKKLDLMTLFENRLGSDLLVLWRKDVVRQLGGFNEGMDLEFAVRLNQHLSRFEEPFSSYHLDEVIAEKPALESLPDLRVLERRFHQTQKRALAALLAASPNYRGISNLSRLRILFTTRRISALAECLAWLVILVAVATSDLPVNMLLLFALFTFGSRMIASLVAILGWQLRDRPKLAQPSWLTVVILGTSGMSLLRPWWRSQFFATR